MAYIKKMRRAVKKHQNMYFHSGTQDAIIKYQQSNDQKEREELYEKEILPAFDQLVENLIFMYGFAKGTDFENLKNDCIAHLYETIEKWDPSRKTNPFSYFNVVAKHYLIIRSKKRKKNCHRLVSLYDPNFSNAEKDLVETYKVVPSPDDIMISRERSEKIRKLLLEIKSRVTGENEIACIDSILEIFNRIDDLDFLNKRAIFVYLREISGLTPKKLSIAMSMIRRHYRELSKTDDFNLF